MIQGVILKDGTTLISLVVEIMAELGEPDCKFIDPYILDENENLISRWMGKYTEQTQFMLSSDSILTIFTPKIKYVDYYKKINGIIDEVVDNKEDENEDEIEEEHY